MGTDRRPTPGLLARRGPAIDNGQGFSWSRVILKDATMEPEILIKLAYAMLGVAYLLLAFNAVGTH
jgi:hypothetical protein